MNITIDQVTWAAGGRPIISNVSAEIASGEVVGIVGPNGAGKSTLLRCVAGLRPPTSGTVKFDGVSIADIPRRELARQLAFVDQHGGSADEMTVGDVVALGRLPYQDRWRGPSHTDQAVVDAAMERLGITHLQRRSWRHISGGERQRAHLARAFAQEPECLILDEPTNHLDIRHQLELMGQLRSSSLTVVVSLHDLQLAARYCDRLLVMRDGGVVADGESYGVLNSQVVDDAFGVHADTGRGPGGAWAISLSMPGVPTRVYED